MTILKTQDEVAACTSAKDLLETLEHLTGEKVKRFSSLAAGRVRVNNALLAATDRAAHAGVPKGTKPEPAAKKAPSAMKDVAKSVTTRPVKVAPEARSRAGAVAQVRAVKGGTSTLQEGSQRAKVLAAIREMSEKAPKGSGGWVAIEDVKAKLGFDPRGFVQKLVGVKHVEVK